MKLSIFTPTYNRGELLLRVYNSLKNQEKDFEWIVVDDGSTDNTTKIIQQITEEAEFPIVYIKKENGGKHTAHNEAVKVASGDYFLCLDSDDQLASEFVHDFDGKEGFLSADCCGYMAYKKDTKGTLLSSDISRLTSNKNIYDISSAASGEYAIILKTKVLQNNLFPVIENEKFMGECVLYDRLDLQGFYIIPMLCVAEICEYQDNGLSANFYKCLIQSPTAFQIFHMQRIDLVKRLSLRVRHIISYHSFQRLSHNKAYQYNGKYSKLVNILYPMGYLGAIYYRFKNLH